MIFEHVNVNEGGQAIVGTVNQGGAKKQLDERPTMRSQDQKRNTLQSTGYGKRQM